MKGVFLDKASVDPGDLDLSSLRRLLTDFTLFDLTAPDELAIRIKDAEIIISNKVVINRQHMLDNPSLKLICVAATGYNNIDIEAAKELGIRVCNVRHYATHSVVEHVFGGLLSMSRHLPAYHRAAKGDIWRNSPFFCVLDYPIQELNGQTIGIIGYGDLGRGVAKKAHQFGMNVLIAQSLAGPKKPDRIELDRLLKESDIVTLHCPLTEESRNLIGKRELSLMKSSAYLVNVARGGIVDEQALADALRNNEVAGAIIDVLSKEPPEPDNPLLASDLLNIQLTPHIAWAGKNARQALINQIGDNMDAFIQGKTKNIVV